MSEFCVQNNRAKLMISQGLTIWLWYEIPSEAMATELRVKAVLFHFMTDTCQAVQNCILFYWLRPE